MRKPFECKEEYTEAMEALKEFTKDKGPGFVLTYNDVEKITGYSQDSPEFNYLLRVRFRKELRKQREIVLSPVNKVGYRFLSPDEVIDERLPLREKKARNQYKYGEQELSTVAENLSKVKSLPKRRLAIEGLKHMKQKRLESNRTLRSLKKTETLPTRKLH